MANKSVKDVTGIIRKITLPVAKTFTAKRGKNIGKSFTIVSIGIMLDDENYYNIKGDSEAKVLQYLYSDKLTRNYAVGDEVKIYLEAEDQEGKYWRIVSICPLNPMENIPVESIESEEPNVTSDIPADLPDDEDAALEEADKQYNMKKIEAPPKQAKIEATATVAPKTPIVEEAKKDMKKVADFKALDADKYELGMAKNSAAIIVSAMIQGHNLSIDGQKDEVAKLGDYYDKLIIALFNRGKKVREQILGY